HLTLLARSELASRAGKPLDRPWERPARRPTPDGLRSADQIQSPIALHAIRRPLRSTQVNIQTVVRLAPNRSAQQATMGPSPPAERQARCTPLPPARQDLRRIAGRTVDDRASLTSIHA